MAKNNFSIFIPAIILSLIALIWIFSFQNRNIRPPKTIQIEKQPAFLASVVPPSSPTPTTIKEPVCDNYQEIERFERPIPIVWTAKLDGCLVSCLGASFMRVPENKKYPRFAGYYPDGQSIPDKFLRDDLILTGSCSLGCLEIATDSLNCSLFIASKG